MRSLREALAGAPAGVLAATLVVLVLGAGLFGFAIAELTSDDESARTVTPPAVIGGSTQGADVPRWPEGLSAHTVVLRTFSHRDAAMRLAEEARSDGIDAGILRSPGGWMVYSGHFTSAAGAEHAASELSGRYPQARPHFVQSSQ